MDCYHTCVVGDSGEGKTTLLREYHADFRGYSVWIDHEGVEGIDGRQGEEYATVESVRELQSVSATRIRFRTSDPTTALERCRDHLRGVYDRTGYPVQVIVDEAQGVMPEGDDYDSGNVLAKMLHEDRDDGVKVVPASQDPQDLARKPIKQCRYLTWVGVPHPNHKGFARYYDLVNADLPTERFEYVVFEKAPGFRWEAQWRDTTDPSY